MSFDVLIDDLTLYEGMCRAASLGLPVAVHAESEAITAGLARRARAAGRTAMRDFLASRPAVAEVQAIARAIALAQESGCSLHVVHVSAGRGVALVAAARGRGIDVSCETCPHYLVLTDEDAEVLGNVATMLPLLLSEGCGARGLPPELIASVTSGYPARRFRLPGKGRLQLGADADLVLVDLTASQELSAADLHYRHRHSPFLGRSLSARVARTLVRGRTVFADGRIVGPPAGRLLIPAIEMESQ